MMKPLLYEYMWDGEWVDWGEVSIASFTRSPCWVRESLDCWGPFRPFPSTVPFYIRAWDGLEFA